MPESFRLYEYEPWCSKGLRHFPVGNYEIFYIVDTDKKKVFVLNVLYGKMNFQEIWKSIIRSAGLRSVFFLHKSFILCYIII